MVTQSRRLDFANRGHIAVPRVPRRLIVPPNLCAEWSCSVTVPHWRGAAGTTYESDTTIYVVVWLPITMTKYEHNVHLFVLGQVKEEVP